MSNDLSKAMSNVPAHIAALMGQGSTSALSTDLAGGLSTGGVPRISLKASRFRIVENGAEIRLKETELNVIIVGANTGVSKTFYAKPWDPDDEPAAPDCWSMDGVFPDESIADPIHDKCGTCPKNQWGSKLTPAGKQIKACADQKRLAVVAADDPGTVYLVQVTPAALQGLAKYNGELKARGLEPNWIVTTLSFDSDASFPKLMFGFGGFPSAEALSAVADIDPDEIRRVAYGDMSIPAPTKAIEAPAEKPAAKAKPKPKAAPVEDADDDEDDEPAPKPKRRMARPVEPKPDDADDEEEAPAPKPKPKLKVVEPDDDDDEEEAPAPAPKAKTKAPVEDDDEDDGLESFAKRKPKAEPEVVAKSKAKPKPRAVPNLEENDEDEAPAPKADKKMASLADSIKAKLSGAYAVEEEDDDA